MLERKYRFQGPNSTRHIQRRGRTVRNGPFSLRFIGQPDNQTSRWAVVVSKKVDKRAVIRNRIRRRVFEALRTQSQATAQPIDATIAVFDASVATMPFSELTKHLQTLLAQTVERGR